MRIPLSTYRVQFNSGFRYLAPLVPFLMFALADHWIRLKPSVRLVAGLLVAGK